MQTMLWNLEMISSSSRTESSFTVASSEEGPEKSNCLGFLFSEFFTYDHHNKDGFLGLGWSYGFPHSAIEPIHFYQICIIFSENDKLHFEEVNILNVTAIHYLDTYTDVFLK